MFGNGEFDARFVPPAADRAPSFCTKWEPNTKRSTRSTRVRGVRDEIVEGQCAVVGSDICEVSLCSSIRINFGYRNRFHRSGGGRGKGHGNQPGYELGQKRRDEFFRRLLDYQS